MRLSRLPRMALLTFAMTIGLAFTSASAPRAPIASAAPADTFGIAKEFFSQEETFIVWKLTPLSVHSYTVTDLLASNCQASGGASCGGIASGGVGTFAKNSPGQYLLVSQKYEVKDGTCEVENHAKWVRESGDKTGEVQATFRCSGATALGWPLLGVASITAMAIAYGAHRRHPWAR